MQEALRNWGPDPCPERGSKQGELTVYAAVVGAHTIVLAVRVRHLDARTAVRNVALVPSPQSGLDRRRELVAGIKAAADEGLHRLPCTLRGMGEVFEGCDVSGWCVGLTVVVNWLPAFRPLHMKACTACPVNDRGVRCEECGMRCWGAGLTVIMHWLPASKPLRMKVCTACPVNGREGDV